MNKGLTITGGVVTGIFLLLAVVGMALSGSAGENLENADDDPSPYYTESVDGSATFTYIDEDRKGSIAFQVLVSLDYVDSDGDGFVDGCSNYTVTVTDEDGTNVTNDVINRGCVFDEWTEEDQVHEGLVISAYVCETLFAKSDCKINEIYTVSVTDSNNESVDFILFDNDAYLVKITEGWESLLGGMGLSSVACCCGMPVGLILLIVGLAIGGPQPQVQMVNQFHMPVGNQVPVVGQMPTPVGQMLSQNTQMTPPISTQAQDMAAPEVPTSMVDAHQQQFQQPPSDS